MQFQSRPLAFFTLTYLGFHFPIRVSTKWKAVEQRKQQQRHGSQVCSFSFQFYLSHSVWFPRKCWQRKINFTLFFWGGRGGGGFCCSLSHFPWKYENFTPVSSNVISNGGSRSDYLGFCFYFGCLIFNL